MAEDIVANADVFSNDLKTTGHSAVYGIYFDTGKSEIKSESEQATGEAEAVVQALVRNHGIIASRLKGHGVGPFAPVASNDTGKGRAKNRRVELVRK
jgi:outer membrane protein OmpA-like peptidoglycan-associated protein